MEKQRVIGIIGGTIWGNRGAESMLVTTIGILRQKFVDSEFIIFSYSPKDDRRLVRDNKIKILSATPLSLIFRILPFSIVVWFLNLFHIRTKNLIASHVFKELTRCNILLDIGGISFVDGRELFLPFNILTILPAMLLKIPVVKMAQAMGPFSNPINKIAAKIILPNCSWIFSRGETTSKNLESINISNFTRAADIAFLFQPEFSLSFENEPLVMSLYKKIERIKLDNNKIVVISPSSLVFQKSNKMGQVYIERIFQLVQELENENTHFLFLPNSTKEGSSKPRNNDIFVIELLMQHALTLFTPESFNRTHWVTWDLNTTSLRKLMSKTDFIITSRFHAMISGLALGIPTLVIGWSHKYLEALADFDLENSAIDFENQQVNLVNIANELFLNETVIRIQIASHIKNVRNLSKSQFEYVEKLLI